MGSGIRGWAVTGAIMLALVLGNHSVAQDNGRHFDETGITVDDEYGFLQFWESHAGAELLGPPITEVVLEANVPVQYFERGRLEHRDGVVIPGEVGDERTRWRSFPEVRSFSSREDVQNFPETGHTLSGAFLRFWREHDGALLFGPPLSEPLWEVVDGASIRVQYFARARLEQRSSVGGQQVVAGRLGREIALARGLVGPDQQPAIAIVEVEGAGNGQAAFAELAPPTPTPIPPTATPIPPTRTPAPPTRTPIVPDEPPLATAIPAAPLPSATPKPAVVGGKMIDVDLSSQWLVAYENGVVVYDAPVATGKDGFNTPTGTYPVYAKVPLQTMRGEANGETWVVPDVPHIMYINGGVALHGTYWHNQFGTGVRMSHGCINLSLADARWLFNWAPMGTKVVVHY